MNRQAPYSDAESRATQLHCLLYWERRQPDAVYLTQPLSGGEVSTYTWRQVAAEVRRMAAHLRARGLPEGSAIALYGKNSAHWIMADLAIWMAGHVSVPLYPTLNAETARFVLDHSEAKLLFIGKLDGKADSWHQVKDVIPPDMPCVGLPLSPASAATPWQDIQQATAPMEDVALPGPDTLATIMYTSGSTGRPKGVMHSFRTMIHVGKLVEEQFGMGPQERALSYLPLAHAAERAMIETVSLYTGTQLYFAHDLQTFLEDLRRARPTFFFSVPRLWTKFQQGINEKLSPKVQRVLFRLPVINRLLGKALLRKLGLEHVRIAITGSAPLPGGILEWYRALGLELLEGYGMTENFAYSHVNLPGDNRLGSVGYAQPGVECRIDASGEVLVKSPGTMLGYYKNPEKTAEDLTPDGFLRTGDMGEIDEKGRLRLTGRVKDLFKTARGKYVAPVPIEQRLGEDSHVEAVCVGGAGQPQPVAFVLLAEDLRAALARGNDRDEVEGALASLLDAVNATLDAHEQMDFLVVAGEPWTMDNGLLTPTLKVRRHAVEARYQSRLDDWSRAGKRVIWE